MNNTDQRKLCVGIPSVAREGVTYLRTAVGSLLGGLTTEERNNIYLMVFLPHSDPTIHPAYKENWLYDLADQVLLYDLPEDKMKHIAALERDAGLFREKGLFDYTYLLKACHSRQTPYVAMFEDDIVAMDGWYHRTITGLDKAQTESVLKKASWDFLYLRLFYTEEFLGWNSEYWPHYLFWSLILEGMLVVVLFSAQHVSVLKRGLTKRSMLFMCCVCLPLLILLFFASGRMTTLPLPIGITEMSNYGCCSQGLVFPREKIEALSEWLELKRIGFVDMLIEEYADQYNELQWAIIPSVIQHVGRHSSKGDDLGPAAKYHMTVAEKIWNFGFEDYNADMLRVEHLRVVQA